MTDSHHLLLRRHGHLYVDGVWATRFINIESMHAIGNGIMMSAVRIVCFIMPATILHDVDRLHNMKPPANAVPCDFIPGPGDPGSRLHIRYGKRHRLPVTQHLDLNKNQASAVVMLVCVA